MIDRRHMRLSFLALVLTSFFYSISSYADALHSAIQEGSEERVLRLIKPGKKLDKPDKRGNTPLHLSAEKGMSKVSIALIEAGADMNAQNSLNGTRPLINAALSNDVDTVQYLLERRANVDAKDFNGMTALKAASMSGGESIAAALIDAGANVNVGMHVGTTPLILAATNGHAAVVNILLDYGAHIDAADSKQNTPLMFASYSGYPDVVESLTARLAGVNKKNSSGHTALFLASYMGRHNVIPILLEAGAKITVVDEEGRTPFHAASISGFDKVGVLLIADGARPIVMEDGEEDLFGTAFSHGTYGKYLEETEGVSSSASYYDNASTYFDRAADEYESVSKTYSDAIFKRRLATVLSIALAYAGASYQANLNAQSSPVGVGYGNAPYVILKTKDLREARKMYRKKASGARTLASEYRERMQAR